ncbi:MAG: transporter [Candidatus Omnitrophica bacterium]|nr:transporter [Candidatus Omnitrophota bacterium]
MALFKVNGLTVTKLLSAEIDREKTLQTIFQNNLEELLNVIFLASEYSTSFGGRIDTLGVDKNGAPVIIEYKKRADDNVINQGLSYLRWLLDHKADFELLCKNKNIDVPIDWDSPRVICIAESYNKYDLDTADILPINVELLRYRIYQEHILYLEPENYQKVKVSTAGIVKKSKAAKEKQQVLQKQYSVEDHLKKANDKIKALFLSLRENILANDEDIKEEPKKLYIAYKLSTNFVDVEIRSKDIKLFLNVKSGHLKDPNHLARDLTKPKPIGHWGNGDYELKIDSEPDIEPAMALVFQSYNFNK